MSNNIKFNKLPLEERMELYNKALELRRTLNWGSRRIAKLLGIKKSCVDGWIYENVIPDFCRIKFEPKKIPELSYLIGVVFGDASLWKSKRGSFNLELKVKDRDFAARFADCINKLFKRKRKTTVVPSGYYYRVQIVNKAFFQFIKERGFDGLKEFIEPYPIEFLQGFFDSEGNPYIEAKNAFNVKVGVVNTNFEILKYVQKLLIEKFGIKSGITIANKAGSETMINNRKIKRNLNVYRLMIGGFSDVKKFATQIGFTAKRKQEKLIDAFNIKENSVSRKDAIRKWKSSYVKIGREWVKKKLVN
jgi:intein-encoded DNA endonuclease-like protein